MFRKACQSCFLKRFPETTSQNCSPKYLCKAVAPKRVCFKPIPQSYSPKQLPKVAPQSYYRKLPKAAPQNCVLKLLPKGAPSFRAAQSCSKQLLSLPRKVVSKSGSPKLFSKAIPQSYRFSKQLTVNAAFKAAKLLPIIAPQSCSSKLLPKTASLKRSPKFQCCYLKLPQSWSGKLSKAAPQSCCPKLFPGAAPQSCAPKLFSKAVALKLRFCKPVHQNGSPKPFCKAAPKSCAPNLLPKVAVQSYSPKAATLQTYTPKRLPKAILQSGSRKLLPKVAIESCSPKLFVKLPPKAAVLQSNCSWKLLRTAYQSCSPKRFPEAASQRCSPKQLCKAVAQSG